MNEITTKWYCIDPKEDELTVRLIPRGGSQYIPMIVSVCIAIFTFFLSVIAFLDKELGLGIIFMFVSIVLVAAVISSIITEPKRLSAFSFTIDESGVTHTDIDGKYTLYWSEIVSFGFVNKNVISGARDMPPLQTCLYFSKNICDEKYLRKRFWRIGNKRYKHCSYNDMVVLALGEDDISNSFKEIFLTYISMYCDRAAEISFMK